MRTFLSLFYLQWLHFLRFKTQALMIVQLGILFVLFFALVFPDLEKTPLSLLFWITILFLSFQSANYFLHQYSASNLLFFFTLVNPITFFLSHFAFFWIYNVFSALIIYSFFSFFFVNWIFLVSDILLIILTILGITNVLIFLSLIAYKAQKQNNLIPILMIPLLLPQLLLVAQYTREMLTYSKTMQFLGGIEGIYLLVSIALFPYLWSD